jgi:outer membrane protein OmpA-like peptidoglycan-associated protein
VKSSQTESASIIREGIVATSLFTHLINEFKGDTLSAAASAIGETPARTETALGSVLPALISGLASKASTSGQATDLLDVIRSNDLDSGRLADAATALKDPGSIKGLGNTGRFLTESLFGGRAGSLADWVASRSGISRSSASSLLNLALPIVLGMIAKRVKAAGWSASNLMALLGEQRSSLPDMPGLTAALNPDVARVETYEGESAPYVSTPERVQATPIEHGPGSRRGGAWLWALPLLLLIPLLNYLMTRGDEPRRVAETTTVPQIAVPRAPIPEPSKPVGTSGFSSAVVRESGPYRIEFQAGSSGITSASEHELRDVAAVLNANVRTRADINGYTNNAGDAEANRRLSEADATAMMNKLVSLGVDRSRLNAHGYGEEAPVADNTTAEGRQRNRRVEIRVITDR